MPDLPTERVIQVTVAEDAAIKIWTESVHKRGSLIDPDDEHDWSTLCYGFLLGQGIEPERASDLSADIIYALQLFGEK